MIFPILSYLKNNSSNIFIKSNTECLTYEDSLNVIFYLIKKLKEKKLFKKRVLLTVPNNVESQLLFLALIHTNDVVLLNPESSEIFVKKIQHKFGVEYILSERLIADSINLLNQIDFEITSSRWYNLEDTDLYPGSVCLMTSGTTGEPSSVKIQHNELVKYGSTLIPYFDISADDCLYNMIPFYHGYGLTRLITVIISGSSMFVPQTMATSHIINNINQFECTWTSLIPRLVKIINKTQTQLWSGFKFATSSASLIDTDTLEKFQTITGKPIFVEYGCSEASIISSNNFHNNKPGSVGKINESHCVIKDGKILFRPQWKEFNEYIDTGDIGFIDNDGFLWISGRSKEIIKKNGRTIFPFELEVVIEKFPGVDDVAAYGINLLTDQEGIGIAYVGECSEETVIKLCQDQLLPFYRPDRVTKIETMPYHGNKLKRLDLDRYVNSLQQ